MEELIFLVVVIVVVIALMFGLCWFLADIEAEKINSKYGTNYTRSDIFWFGDKIVLSDHIVIKAKE